MCGYLLCRRPQGANRSAGASESCISIVVLWTARFSFALFCFILINVKQENNKKKNSGRNPSRPSGPLERFYVLPSYALSRPHPPLTDWIEPRKSKQWKKYTHTLTRKWLSEYHYQSVAGGDGDWGIRMIPDQSDVVALPILGRLEPIVRDVGCTPFHNVGRRQELVIGPQVEVLLPTR